MKSLFFAIFYYNTENVHSKKPQDKLRAFADQLFNLNFSIIKDQRQT